MIEPYLSVVIPAYNEDRRIGKTLVALKKYLDTRNYSYEVLVSDDGSTDTTLDIVKVIQETWPQLRFIVAPKNLGKGAAVKQGMLAARGRFLLFTDADNSTPIAEVEKFWPHTGTHQVVIGSRHCPGAKVHIKQAPHRILLSRASNLLIRLLAVPGTYDTQCGFKLFEKNAGKSIFANVTLKRWGFDFEALMIARILKYRTKEVGVEWFDDPDSKFASKEAIRTLLDLFRIKWRMIKGGYNQVGYVQEAAADVADVSSEIKREPTVLEK